MPRMQEDRVVEDPPLLSLEIAASHAYLTMLLFLHTSGSAAMQEACKVSGWRLRHARRRWLQCLET